MTIEEFKTLWINSQLTSQQEAHMVADVFQEKCRKWDTPASAELFCEFLVNTNRLTAWQCDKLRMGKWKGFYLGNFVLLEQIGKDHESSTYKGRDTRDNELVRIAVTPIAQSKSADIEYRVYRYSD